MRVSNLVLGRTVDGHRGLAGSTRAPGAAGGEGKAGGPRRDGHREPTERFCDKG